MKWTSWGIIIVTLLLVAAFTISLDKWANQWKDLFFYLDNWWMWIILAAAVWVIKKIFDWTLKAEVRLLK